MSQMWQMDFYNRYLNTPVTPQSTSAAMAPASARTSYRPHVQDGYSYNSYNSHNSYEPSDGYERYQRYQPYRGSNAYQTPQVSRFDPIGSQPAPRSYTDFTHEPSYHTNPYTRRYHSNPPNNSSTSNASNTSYDGSYGSYGSYYGSYSNTSAAAPTAPHAHHHHSSSNTSNNYNNLNDFNNFNNYANSASAATSAAPPPPARRVASRGLVGTSQALQSLLGAVAVPSASPALDYPFKNANKEWVVADDVKLWKGRDGEPDELCEELSRQPEEVRQRLTLLSDPTSDEYHRLQRYLTPREKVKHLDEEWVEAAKMRAAVSDVLYGPTSGANARNAPNFGKKWSHEDDYLLWQNRDAPVAVLSGHFGRSVRSIECRLFGLRSRGSAEHERLFRKKTEQRKECVSELSVLSALGVLGDKSVNAYKRWSVEEDEFVWKNRKCTINSLATSLGRTKGSVRSRLEHLSDVSHSAHQRLFCKQKGALGALEAFNALKALGGIEQKENKTNEGRGECLVCMSEKAVMVCIPCGHLVLCERCASAQSLQAQCVVCRSGIQQIIRTYSS